MAKALLSVEQREWVKARYSLTANKILVEEIRQEFDIEVTERYLKKIAYNYGFPIKQQKHKDFRSTFKVKVLSQEAYEWLKANYDDFHGAELSQMIYERFGEKVHRSILSSLASKHGFSNNKKVEKQYPFIKGEAPHNLAEIGAIAFNPLEYKIIKIGQPSKWVKLHHFVWENANGKFDRKTEVIMFRDGDKSNCRLENLVKMPRSAFSKLMKSKEYDYKNTDESIKPSLELTALLETKIKELADE